MLRAMRNVLADRAGQSGALWVFYSGASWNAGGGCQRPQQLAEAAAEAGAAVVHLSPANSALCKRDGVVVRPVRDWEHIRNINAPQRVLVVGFPDKCGHTLMHEANGWIRVYDCLDDWEAFAQYDFFMGDLALERDLVQQCDVVTATSRCLAEKWASVRGDTIHYLPNSTMMPMTRMPRAEVTTDCVGLGYWGGAWIEWRYVTALLDAGLKVRLIGQPPAHNQLCHDNLEWIGMLPWRQVPTLLAQAQVGIVPFADMPITYAVDPIKYYDYIAVGLPTVASHMPELEGRPYATVVQNAQDFVDAVKAYIEHPPARRDVKHVAFTNTYKVRFQQLCDILREARHDDTA